MSKPPQLIPRRCTASGQDFTHYSVEWSPDKRNITPCPVCLKAVKLMAKYRACRHPCSLQPRPPQVTPPPCTGQRTRDAMH